MSALATWNAVLLDDDEHTYEYVVEMLTTLFGFTARTAYLMAVEVDKVGRVVIWSGERERVEEARAAVTSYGADPRLPGSQGSMIVILEPMRTL